MNVRLLAAGPALSLVVSSAAGPRPGRRARRPMVLGVRAAGAGRQRADAQAASKVDGTVEFTNEDARLVEVGRRWERSGRASARTASSSSPTCRRSARAGRSGCARAQRKGGRAARNHRHRAGAGHVVGAFLALRPAHSGSAIVLRHPRAADPRRHQDRVRLRSQRRVERRRQGADAADAGHRAPDGRDRRVRSAAEHHGRRALLTTFGAPLLQDAGAVQSRPRAASGPWSARTTRR